MIRWPKRLFKAQWLQKLKNEQKCVTYQTFAEVDLCVFFERQLVGEVLHGDDEATAAELLVDVAANFLPKR